ncbi:hypothetical protein GYMLUDRAFT_144962, partial [Collybiopsis luxurians FD-317 M1]
AYYHDNKPGDPRLPHDTPRTVPLEYLDKLGWSIFSVDGPDFESNARDLAKQQGYPLTEE